MSPNEDVRSNGDGDVKANMDMDVKLNMDADVKSNSRIDLSIDNKRVAEEIEDFIIEVFKKAGFEKAVLGLSGGIDSALVAYLVARALGPENLIGIIMPYKTSSPQSVKDANLIADKLGIKTETIDLTPMIDAYFSLFPDADRLRRGNKMARERMSILFDRAVVHRALVVGTSNRTEMILGYSMLYGDSAWALNPIGSLYKTQVWSLSRYLGIPEEVVRKAPTGDLWENQTDEGELGFTYAEVDRYLYGKYNLKMSKEELLAEGFSPDFIEKVERRIERNRFKLEKPPIAEPPSLFR